METFSPHFSHALARFIAREAKKTSAGSAPPRKVSPPGRRRRAGDGGGGGSSSGGERLVLYEAGGGTGTNALNVLDWLRREEPKLYERTEYTIIEISPRLAELQTERVCSVHEVRANEQTAGARTAVVELPAGLHSRATTVVRRQSSIMRSLCSSLCSSLCIGELWVHLVFVWKRRTHSLSLCSCWAWHKKSSMPMFTRSRCISTTRLFPTPHAGFPFSVPSSNG